MPDAVVYFDPLVTEFTGAIRVGNGHRIIWNEEGSQPAAAPLIGLTITRVDSTHIVIDFALPVLLLPTLTWVGAYLFDPVIVVREITPGTVTELGLWDSVTRVTARTDEQSPANYTVTIFGLEPA